MAWEGSLSRVWGKPRRRSPDRELLDSSVESADSRPDLPTSLAGLLTLASEFATWQAGGSRDGPWVQIPSAPHGQDCPAQAQGHQVIADADQEELDWNLLPDQLPDLQSHHEPGPEKGPYRDPAQHGGRVG